MEIGPHYEKNSAKFNQLGDNDLRIALKKCKDHIKIKLRQKTLYGAHSEKNLGSNPIEHYLSLVSEKLLTGQWEWKDQYSLSEQMIRIANSWISTEVEKSKSEKASSFKIEYKDLENEFYNLGDKEFDTAGFENTVSEKLKRIESAINGDDVLEFFWEAVKEGKKRVEIAELLELEPRQLDKLRERFIRTVRNYEVK